MSVQILTIEDANKYLKSCGYDAVIDRMSDCIGYNDYTKHYHVHIVDQRENTTETFKVEYPDVQEYNNVLLWAIGHEKVFIRYIQ